MKLYRNPHIPGIVFRKLRKGESIRKTDFGSSKQNSLYGGWIEGVVGEQKSPAATEHALLNFYRPLPHLSNLPE